VKQANLKNMLAMLSLREIL